MAKPPVLRPREVAALLERLGFRDVRQRGSHKRFRHADGRVTTVPFHGNRDVAPSLLRKIARDIQVVSGRAVWIWIGRAMASGSGSDVE